MNGLRFFVNNDSDAVRVELAGSLRGADVETVHHAWQGAASLSAEAGGPLCAVSTDALKPVIVDITFIADEHGRALLVLMHRSSARMMADHVPAGRAVCRRRTSGTSRDSASCFGS